MPTLAWFIRGRFRPASGHKSFRSIDRRHLPGILVPENLGRDRTDAGRVPGRGPSRCLASSEHSLSVEALARRLERLEQQNAKLATQNRSLVKQLEAVTNTLRSTQPPAGADRTGPGLAVPRPACSLAAHPGSLPRRFASAASQSRAVPGHGSRVRGRHPERGNARDSRPARAEPAGHSAWSFRLLEVPGRRLRRSARHVRPGSTTRRPARSL